MIHLSNGAKVLAAYVVQQDHDRRPYGVVLAETDTDFVTWRVWKGEPLQTTFDAESGHYFHKRGEMERGADRQEAEIDFGKRLAYIITSNTFTGLRAECSM